jgi:hypothetical protein
MTYLATAYSHPDPAVMEQRFDLACRIAGSLMARGEIVFSPPIPVKVTLDSAPIPTVHKVVESCP